MIGVDGLLVLGVLDLHSLALSSCFDSCAGNSHGGSAFQGADGRGLACLQSANKVFDLVLHVVTLDLHGDPLGNGKALVNIVLVTLEQLQVISAGLVDQSAAGAVDAGTHGVAALNTDTAEDLTDNIVGELVDSDAGVVYRPLGQILVVGVGFKNGTQVNNLDAEGSDCARYTFDYPSKAGLGHFIHTYVTDGNPIPTFQGEPERVAITNDIDEFTNALWNSLDEDNKISLYVRYIDVDGVRYESRMINKNENN